MIINVIKTEKYYQEAMSGLEIIFDSKFGSPEVKQLEVFGRMIGEYEDEHYPVGLQEVNTRI